MQELDVLHPPGTEELAPAEVERLQAEVLARTIDPYEAADRIIDAL